MPVYSAPEAMKTLQESGRSLPFIIVSGTIDEKLVSELIEHGTAGSVGKGDLSKLDPAVAGVLSV